MKDLPRKCPNLDTLSESKALVPTYTDQDRVCSSPSSSVTASASDVKSTHSFLLERPRPVSEFEYTDRVFAELRGHHEQSTLPN
jgi:hypothetical protein